MNGPRGPARPALFVAALVFASGLIRVGVADFAHWGVDEAANLWQGARLLSGEAVPIGLFSSRGVPNLAGAPALAAPLSLLPDLVSVSVVLSLLHLGALLALGLALGRRTGRTATLLAALAFQPALLLASSGLWNQYLAALFAALLYPVLLSLSEGVRGPYLGAAALVAFAALALAQPACHLASFADLGVQAVVLAAILLLRPPAVSTRILAPGLAAVFAAAAFLYLPWLRRVVNAQSDGLAAAGILAVAAVAVALSRRQRLLAAVAAIGDRAFRSRAGSWLWLASLLASVAAVAVVPFTGAQAGWRLLQAREPAGLLLLASQAGMAATVLPELARILRDCRAGTPLGALLRRALPGLGRATALIVAAYPLALLGLRLLLEPAVLVPGARADLLVPLVPSLLGPMLLLAGSSRIAAVRHVLRISTGASAAGLLWLSLTGLSPAFRRTHPTFVPASEMTAAVDDVAARHRAAGGGPRIDLGYDLGQGLEWVTAVACRPSYSWYSIGRPYDWLLLRRHGLRNTREGECSRLGGTSYQLGFAATGAPPSGLLAVRRLGQIEVRAPGP